MVLKKRMIENERGKKIRKIKKGRVKRGKKLNIVNSVGCIC